MPPSSPKAEYAVPDRKGPKAFGHTCFVPSGAKQDALLLTPICQWRTRTSNVTLVTPRIAFVIGFNYQVSISCSFHMEVGQPTSAKTAPYLMALSTDFSIDPLIIGVYSFSKPSSSWSDERRASPYADIIRSRGWAVGANIRTVLFAENRTARYPLCFPMTTASILPNQICADGLAITTDSIR